MTRLSRVVLLVAVWFVGASRVEAIPVLQLDMMGGVYDATTQTIVAPGGQFTLYAVLTPKENATAAQIAALLNETYYISVALTPQVSSPTTLGSFTFGLAGGAQTTYSATGDGPGGNADLIYGVPPIDSFMQNRDAGDLSQHGIYPTYFAEFSFQFQPARTTIEYNSQDQPGGLSPSADGTAYYIAFTGDSSLLAFGYNLHFDLYDTLVKDCARSFGPACEDVDVDRFAPFSHDAGTYTPPPPPPPPNVPEPTSLLFVTAGLALTPLLHRRRAT